MYTTVDLSATPVYFADTWAKTDAVHCQSDWDMDGLGYQFRTNIVIL